MSGFKEYECVNCGHKAWSLREVGKCEKCQSVVICKEQEKTDSKGSLNSKLVV